jgi:RNA polymerase sigma-70 factor (ECF subfamily)
VPDEDVHEMMVLVRDHDERLRGLAYKLLGGDRDRMDDALQDAYLRAFAAFPRFRREADPGTWLYRIVYNACIDELRRTDSPISRPRPDAVARDDDDDDDDDDEGDDEGDDAATVRALAALPVDQRVTVVLVDGEGFDSVAAARILGVRTATVASRLSRARASMHEALTTRTLTTRTRTTRTRTTEAEEDAP